MGKANGNFYIKLLACGTQSGAFVLSRKEKAWRVFSAILKSLNALFKLGQLKCLYVHRMSECPQNVRMSTECQNVHRMSECP